MESIKFKAVHSYKCPIGLIIKFIFYYYTVSIVSKKPFKMASCPCRDYDKRTQCSNSLLSCWDSGHARYLSNATILEVCRWYKVGIIGVLYGL